MMKIEIIDAYKKIHKADVINGITYTMTGGKIYGLQGKNGSGKTMLIRAICGLIHLTEGQILHDGRILGRDLEFPESIGLLLENPAFLDEYSGFDNLRQIAAINHRIHDTTIEQVMTEVGLDAGDHKKYRKYSLGMKQRLGIAAAIMENPDLLILDEPTNALDAEGVESIRNVILSRKHKDRIIIIASHDKEELDAIADEVLVLQNGRLQEVLYPGKGDRL